MSEAKNPTTDFEIDPHALHRELLRQPGLSWRYGQEEADARRAHDRAKSALAVVEARLGLSARRNPAAFGLREKPTKDEVDAAVALHEDHRKAVDFLTECRYVLDICAAAVAAQIDRRKALERLVDLKQIDYYSEREPRVPAQTREQMQRHLDETERGGVVFDPEEKSE